ncbi:hypothetical protein Bca4012_092763 [Brassica carinata]|uniref:Uncharacterized protein n=1 Tax=Brassica napus TaxID=3708 RepID=A0ABQ7Y3P4_BRANA|nr:late embryogenesis abundant protein 6-like [Brassica napus]KAH0862802.1 hypothetical protein HID58_080013 [Brassica napus]
MQSAKQKLSDLASTAKKKMVICRAKAEEKAEKARAQTKEEKKVAHERRKAREAEAKLDMHVAKEAHAEEKLMDKQSHYHVSQSHVPHHTPVTTPQPVVGHGYGHNHPAAYPPTAYPPTAYPTAYPPEHHHHHPYGNV